MNLRIEQWSGVWAMSPSRFDTLESTVRNTDLAAHIAAQRAAMPPDDEEDDAPPAKKPYELVGKSAVISLTGTMTKYGSSMTGPGTLQVRRALGLAASDPRVEGILFRVDSPGGTVHGTDDLAAAVASAAAQKPLVAFIEDLGASAAYYTASQAPHISVNPAGEVGSIGVFQVVYDVSEAFSKEGVKTHVLRSAPNKALGATGEPITDEALAQWQAEVDRIHEMFVDRVASGRTGRMTREQVAKAADGRVYDAKTALSLGLVDSIESIEQALARLQTLIAERKAMSAQTTPTGASEAKTATLAELKALPGCTAEQREAWLERGATLAEATAENTTMLAAENKDLAERLRASEAEAAKAKAEAAKASTAVPTVAVTTSNDASPIAVEAWEKNKDKLAAWGVSDAKQLESIDRRFKSGQITVIGN